MEKKEKIYQIKNKRIHIILQSRNPKIMLVMITSLDTIRSRFHILIEPSLCLAFGGCESISPKVFVVDKSKHINPKARVQSEAADTLDRITKAAQACPTKAIRIIDRYTGNQIYP
jgi:ferredoxin